MTFAESQVVFYDLWGSFRLYVGNKDVSEFRGVTAQIGGYQLVEPYGYGPATFALPQLTPFEVDAWGTGELRWMGNGKPVKLIQVDASGSRVRTVWEGFVSRPNVTDAGVILECSGKASGRLSQQIKASGLYSQPKHAGRKIYDALTSVGLKATPHLGGDVGPIVDERGMQSWMIDYTDTLLAATTDTDGSAYTVMPNAAGEYRIALKDTSTIDFTVHYGAAGVSIDLADDLTEKPTTYYGHGVTPDGLVWNNAKHPQMIQGSAPTYPNVGGTPFGAGTVDGDTGSSDGVTVMIHKLVGTGYLNRTKVPGGYDDDVVRAVKDLQDDAGLTESGTMNPATWDALFDVTDTGLSAEPSFIAPLAQDTRTRKWDRTANGSISGKNPHYDPSVVPVEVWIDFGTSCEIARARRFCKGLLAQSADKNWAGTVTLTADVFAGLHTHGDVSPTQLSRLDITPGMNHRLKNFDGGTNFHVSVVNVTGDTTVTLGVDTRARDAATLGEVIARKIESRIHPARLWKRQHLSGVNSRQVEASIDFGILFNREELTGDAWNVVEILGGEAGSVSRVRIQTEGDEAAFCVAFFAQKPGLAWLNQKVGNPFDTNAHGESKWTNAGVQNLIDRQRSLLAAYGDDAQPGGYHPRSHTNAAGDTTDAPITGLMLEDAGFDYHTFGEPVIYMAIYPDRDTVLKPQRILWAVEESDA